MAQLKGVFQSLIQLDLPLDEILVHANSALSRCLEKKTFITMTLYLIDAETQMLKCARAGHCPTLYYKKEDQKVVLLDSKGLGLGILRSQEFAHYIELYEQPFHPEDIMLLYTDGIVEAKRQ